MLVEQIDSSDIVCHDGIVTDGRLGVSVVVQIGFYMYVRVRRALFPSSVASPVSKGPFD
jgi:hypothetical protein